MEHSRRFRDPVRSSNHPASRRPCYIVLESLVLRTNQTPWIVLFSWSLFLQLPAQVIIRIPQVSTANNVFEFGNQIHNTRYQVIIYLTIFAKVDSPNLRHELFQMHFMCLRLHLHGSFLYLTYHFELHNMFQASNAIVNSFCVCHLHLHLTKKKS